MFKFSSLAPHLVPHFFRAKEKTAPFDVIKYLSTNQIEAPENTITNSYIPYLDLRRIFFIHEARRSVCPIRSNWDKAIIETSTEAVVSFQDIKGCISSKSGLTDFEAMRHHPKSSGNVNFHISAYKDRVEELAEKVLNGTMDCAVYKDRPAKIVTQEWAPEMWLSNDGGSHRSAAVWHLDREQGRERLLPAQIKTNSLSPDFRNQCAENSIWLFKFQTRPNIHEICSKFKESGILLSVQSFSTTFSESPDLCMIVKKSDPRHAEIAAAMKQVFNLSEWVNEAYGSNLKATPVITPQREITLQ